MNLQSELVESEMMGTKRIVLISLTVSLAVTAAVSGESEMPVMSDLPVTYRQMKELQEAVCADIAMDEKSIFGCQLMFSNPSRSLVAEPAAIDIKCQSPESLTFKITPSDSWQLVIFVPDIDSTDVFDHTIHYALIEPDKALAKISAPANNYTVWTSVLTKKGVPSVWRRGQDVEVWDETRASKDTQRYHVDIDFEYEKSTMIDVQIRWNKLDETDLCFYVVNQCRTSIREKNIGPDDPSTLKLQGLSLDDHCTVFLTGKYGVTKAAYQTPSCYDLEGCEPLPDIPANVTATAYETSVGWGEVHVGWKKPRRTPTYYNITIRAENDNNVEAPGNATDVIIKDVLGTGLYSISIVAVTSTAKAHTTRRALFPTRVGKSSESLTMLVAWSAVLTLAVALVGVGLCCRKLITKLRRPYFIVPDYKLPKDCEIDLTGPDCIMNDDHWEVRADKVQLHEVIGEGAFGVVRRGTVMPAGKDVAVKMLKGFPTSEEIRSFRAEMELMKSVGWHPHVAHLVGCCSGSNPLILAEYCSRGDLLTYLRHSWDVMVSKRNAKYYNNNIEGPDYRDIVKSKNKESLSKLVSNKLYDLEGVCDPELNSIDLLSFCRQIAKGMEFLASNRVVHRDLAARNILVSGDRTLKIADFGLSRDVYQENQYKQKGNGKMPVKWMALESLTHRIYTSQSDVWSFGVVMWEVVTVGGAPYSEVQGARLPRLLRAGYRMPRPNNCSKHLYQLMVSCWYARPRDRPTFTELHRALDVLLNSACADTYLSLELEPPASPMPYRYFKLLTSAKLGWGYGTSYERPFKTPQTNHYSSPPVVTTTHHIV